jgi:hypothetical protein
MKDQKTGVINCMNWTRHAPPTKRKKKDEEDLNDSNYDESSGYSIHGFTKIS